MSICYIDNWMYNAMSNVQVKTECTMKYPMPICLIDNWMYSEKSDVHLYNW